jgi:spermidine synthase
MTKGTFSHKWIVFFTIITSGLCSIIYELLVSTTSSYLLGDSIKQFSLVIGVYMASMGVGSYFSQFIEKNLLSWFVKVEIALGLVGGLSVPILYAVFESSSESGFQFIMLFITFLIGFFTGYEIPLLIRFLTEYFTLKSNLAYVLNLDYIGALIATLIFPFIFLPFVGTFKTSLIFGFANLVMGLVVYNYFSDQESNTSKKWIRTSIFSAMAIILALYFYSDTLLSKWENSFYKHQVVYTKHSQYQQINLTKNREEIRLYINKIIQFSSVDEHRYHEALGYLPVCLAPYKQNVLILGGGEGLLVREVLKNEKVQSVTIVDLDKEIFELAKTNKYLTKINQNVLSNPKVHLVVNDAMVYLQNNTSKYDIIISDLPDPSNESLSRLYSTTFFRLIQSNLASNGVFATQASSPFHTNMSFWCIVETLKSSGFKNVIPYHTYVPSFGEWGFVVGSNTTLNFNEFKSDSKLKYLDSTVVKSMLYFDNDFKQKRVPEINKMDNAQLMKYFNSEWSTWSKETIE